MFLLDTYFIIPIGFGIMLEAFLTGVLVALIGAAGYTFFVYSMKDDRAEKRLQRYYDANNYPWEKLSKQDDDKKRRPRIQKSTLIGIILLLAAVIVLIFLILVVNHVHSAPEVT